MSSGKGNTRPARPPNAEPPGEYECPRCGCFSANFAGDSCRLCGDRMCTTCDGRGDRWDEQMENYVMCQWCHGTGQQRGMQ